MCYEVRRRFGDMRHTLPAGVVGPGFDDDFGDTFGIIYGLSAFGLARQLGIPQSEAAAFIARYFERYAQVRGFIDATLEQARRDGEVRTLFGRRRPIPDLDSRNPNLRGFAERTAVNTRLQGTAADLMRLAMIRVWRRLQGTPARLLLQVHDELVLEAPKQRAAEFGQLLQVEMQGVDALSVPLTVEAGAEWLTPPIDRGAEIRGYIRDPDGHLIEVGQATGMLEAVDG